MEKSELNNLTAQKDILTNILKENDTISAIIRSKASDLYKDLDKNVNDNGIVHMNADEFKKVHAFMSALRGTYSWGTISNVIEKSEEKIELLNKINKTLNK